MKQIEWQRNDSPGWFSTCWVLLLMFSFPVCSLAENLIVNPTFDTDLTGWDHQFSHPDAYWDMEDANGDLDSGSVNLIKSDDDGSLILVFQCVPVEPDTVYSFGADFKLFTTGVAPYLAGLLLYPKSTSNCGGGPVGASAYTEVNMAGSWITTSSTIKQRQQRKQSTFGLRWEMG